MNPIKAIFLKRLFISGIAVFFLSACILVILEFDQSIFYSGLVISGMSLVGMMIVNDIIYTDEQYNQKLDAEEAKDPEREVKIDRLFITFDWIKEQLWKLFILSIALCILTPFLIDDVEMYRIISASPFVLGMFLFVIHTFMNRNYRKIKDPLKIKLSFKDYQDFRDFLIESTEERVFKLKSTIEFDNSDTLDIIVFYSKFYKLKYMMLYHTNSFDNSYFNETVLKQGLELVFDDVKGGWVKEIYGTLIVCADSFDIGYKDFIEHNIDYDFNSICLPVTVNLTNWEMSIGVRYTKLNTESIRKWLKEFFQIMHIVYKGKKQRPIFKR